MIKLTDALSRYVKGDQDAVSFILTIHSIAETWDDLIDKDKVPTDDQVNAAFYAAMVTIPRNPFYRNNFGLLSPLIESSILDWFTANEFEKSKDAQKLHLAYGLRFTTLALTTMCARIVGGIEWAKTVNAEFRALAEPWADYSHEHGLK